MSCTDISNAWCTKIERLCRCSIVRSISVSTTHCKNGPTCTGGIHWENQREPDAPAVWNNDAEEVPTFQSGNALIQQETTTRPSRISFIDDDEAGSSGSWETVSCDSDDSKGGVRIDDDVVNKNEHAETRSLQEYQPSEIECWSTENEENEQDTTSQTSLRILTPTTSDASDSASTFDSGLNPPRHHENGSEITETPSSPSQDNATSPTSSQTSIHIDLFPYDSSSDSDIDEANEPEGHVTTASPHDILNMPDMVEEVRRISIEHDEGDGVLIPVPDELEEEQFDVVDTEEIDVAMQDSEDWPVSEPMRDWLFMLSRPR